MKDSIFLKACRKEQTPRTPAWYMRQAGRTSPAYMKIREKYDVLTISKVPELAARVSLQPVTDFDVDAIILFADIMIPLLSLGVELDIVEGVGPVIQHSVGNIQDVRKLRQRDPVDAYAYLQETIGLIQQEAGERAVIGFCGAPFTLASYLIEGKPTRDFVKTKRFMYEQPAAWKLLLEKLAEAMIVYLQAQVRAGIDAYQVFDSWVGYLSVLDYVRYILPYTEKIFRTMQPAGIPSIHFGTNTAHLLKAFASVSCDVVSLDWRIPIGEAWKVIGYQKAVQGNLDPAVLLCDMSIVRQKTDEIFRGLPQEDGFIFNLGHGILPNTPPGHIRQLTDYVHSK